MHAKLDLGPGAFRHAPSQYKDVILNGRFMLRPVIKILAQELSSIYCDSVSSLKSGLRPNGYLMLVGGDVNPLEISPMDIIAGRRSLMGWASVTAMDSEDTMNFFALSNTNAMVETYPLEEAEEPYKNMLSNKARFRSVIVMD